MEALRNGYQDLVVGRLLQVHIAHGSSPTTVIVMRPRTIRIHDVKVPLAAFRYWRNRRQRREMMLPEFWQQDSGR